MRAEGLEHADIAFALCLQFVPLRPVVVNLRGTFEHLRAKAVLRMEMGERQHQRTLAGNLLRRFEYLLAIGGSHAGVDDERGVAAENDPDVRHERHTSVANDEHAGRDFRNRAWINNGWWRCGTR